MRSERDGRPQRLGESGSASQSNSKDDRRALDGLQVLDLSAGVAGAFCARYLAGFGADVVKIEAPGGDATRRSQPFSDGDRAGTSALFEYINAGKRSFVVDLQSADGKSQLRSLADQCDVLIEDCAAGALPLGFSYEELSRASPRLVWTSITPFGHNGPYSAHPWVDLTISAWGGLLHTTGAPEREPLVAGGQQTEYQAGAVAATATMAAVLGAKMSGRGAWVDCSMMEAVSIMLDPNIYWNEVDPAKGGIWAAMSRRLGRQSPGAPRGLWPCRDGWVMVIPRLDRPVASLAELTGDARFADPRFQSPDGRSRYADEIAALLLPWLLDRSREEIVTAAQARGHYFGYLVDVAELLRSPQLTAREFFQVVQHPRLGPCTVPGGPAALRRTPWRCLPAPDLGANGAVSWQGRASIGREDPTRVAQEPTSSAGGPLVGIRVLDLTRAWAGPLATKFLADWGADVVKVHAIRFGDARRDPTRSAYWRLLDGNKRALGIDFGTPRGQEVVRRLARSADVVVENFSPGVLRKFSLDYDNLSVGHDSLVMVSMPGFGSTGPFRDYRALGETIEAMSGLMSLTGYRDEDAPMKSGVNYGDPVAGITAAMATLIALYHRVASGRGQWVEVSHLEAAVNWLGEWVLRTAASGELPARWGNGSPNFAPHGVYRAAGEDRWIALAARDELEWRRLLGVLESDPLAEDERFRTLASRTQHIDELDRLIGRATSRYDARELALRLMAEGVPAAPVQTARDLLADPHHASRGFWSLATGEEYGVSEYLYNRSPATITGSTGELKRSPPSFSEHLDEVLRDWAGCDDAEIADLLSHGAVARSPLHGGGGLVL